MDAVRLDAEPLQPDLSRRGAGDDEAVCCGRDRGHSVESAGTWEADTAVGCRGDETVGDGPVQQGDLLEDGGGRQEGGRPAGRGGREARDSAGDVGAGLGVEQTGDYVADRGRDEAEPSYGCRGGVAGEADC